jgi:histidine triad (HIT) family protein
MEDCIFCKFVGKTIPVDAIYEDEGCIAIRDREPRAPIHLLIIPKEHIPSSLAVGPENERLAGHLVAVAGKLARAEGIAESGFRLVFNTLADAGQTVFHLHLHVLGGRKLGPMG